MGETPIKDARIGTLLAGKYQIEARIGRGGMGTIYRATHLMLGKPVAIKLINPDIGVSSEMAARFQREARAASNLNHPNIATVHDLGQLDDGTLYMAMEFIDGETLKAVIGRDGPIAPARIVRLLEQITSALAVAHKNGIVHRDLKPQNIMVARDANGREAAILLDFGIAKTLDDAATQLTATGLSLGTPHYMAPEQANGGAVDARSDIYALGVILYEMLTGQVPFEGASTPAVLIKHLSEVPSRPSERRPDLRLPPELEAVALRCLEKDPAKRFQSSEELHAALTSDGAAADPTAIMPAPLPTASAPPGAVSGDRDGADRLDKGEAELPPRSALQNLTSVGGPATSAADVTPRESRAAGHSVLLVVLVLVLVGGVGFVAYSLGYLSSPGSTASSSLSLAEGGVQPPEVPPTEDPPPAASPAASTTQAPPRDGGAATGGGSPAGPPARRGPADAQVAAVATSGDALAAGRQAGATPATPPPVVEPPRPEHPTVRFGCDGPAEVCMALQSALDREFERASMPSVSDESRAELLVDALVVAGQSRAETLFGQTMVIQPYTVSLVGSARRYGERVPMPEPRAFTLDERVGQARLVEQSRLIASAAIEKLRAYWASKQ